MNFPTFQKCVTELLDLYKNEEAREEICQNSQGEIKGNANWSYIMLVVHQLVLDVRIIYQYLCKILFSHF